MCNLNKQKQIDPSSKMITFSTDFCKALIFEFKDYIKFMNVILIDYLDMILQYIRCF